MATGTIEASKRHPRTPVRSRRLAALKGQVERALRASLRAPQGTPDVLVEAMRYCVASRGKRFRPLLCLGACEAAGASAQRALTVACAIELIHTYSLVHDDLPAMDDADRRRGQPSCHRRFGEATAILVGDALLTRAFELLGSATTPNLLAILRTIGQASGTAGLIGGQVLDLDGAIPHARSRTHRARSKARQLEETAQRKTGALITASVVAGALAGQATSATIGRLRRCGRRLGLAFQLRDDLHDGDGLVQALGARTVRRKFTRLMQQAREDLVPFGRRASVLVELSGWLSRS